MTVDANAAPPRPIVRDEQPTPTSRQQRGIGAGIDANPALSADAGSVEGADSVKNTPAPASRTRASVATIDERGLIAQPHGGFLRPRTPANGQAADRTSVRACRKTALQLISAGTPDAAEKLVALIRSSDERVACIAAQATLDRGVGKPGDVPQTQEGDAPGTCRINPRLLTEDEQEEVAAAADTLQRYAIITVEREQAEVAA